MSNYYIDFNHFEHGNRFILNSSIRHIIQTNIPFFCLENITPTALADKFNEIEISANDGRADQTDRQQTANMAGIAFVGTQPTQQTTVTVTNPLEGKPSQTKSVTSYRGNVESPISGNVFIACFVTAFNKNARFWFESQPDGTIVPIFLLQLLKVVRTCESLNITFDFGIHKEYSTWVKTHNLKNTIADPDFMGTAQGQAIFANMCLRWSRMHTSSSWFTTLTRSQIPATSSGSTLKYAAFNTNAQYLPETEKTIYLSTLQSFGQKIENGYLVLASLFVPRYYGYLPISRSVEYSNYIGFGFDSQQIQNPYSFDGMIASAYFIVAQANPGLPAVASSNGGNNGNGNTITPNKPNRPSKWNKSADKQSQKSTESKKSTNDQAKLDQLFKKVTDLSEQFSRLLSKYPDLAPA